ncbi:MAG TPA: hypothetical protein VG389_04970 [Myxococcota bacterium]|jgi:hypothetical protein|nr:hypothetical protein [Myxococcota bacterium]
MPARHTHRPSRWRAAATLLAGATALGGASCIHENYGRTIHLGSDPTQCNDAMDDDGDLLVDAADPGCQGTSDDGENERTEIAPYTPAHAATVLFVIDDSGSMCEEQTNLRTNFESFITAFLGAAPGVPYHLGVVTTDTSSVSVAGRLRNSPQTVVASPLCPTPPPPLDCTTGLPSPLPKWIDPTTPEPARTFGCLASVGIMGFGGETALGAADMAFSPTLVNDPTANQGFYIPESLVAIVFLGDEDDCSVCFGTACAPLPGLQFNLDCSINRVTELTAVSYIVAEVTGSSNLAGGTFARDGVYVSAIIGLDPDGNSDGPIMADPGGADSLVPICSIAGQGGAAPAPRIDSFTRSFALHEEHSICDTDYGPALGALGGALATMLNSGCLGAPPCDGISTADVVVQIGGAPPLGAGDFDIVPDAGCAGGWRVELAVPADAGTTLSVTYPEGAGPCP